MERQTLTLRRRLERTIAHGHPWIWRDALEAHDLPAGAIVDVIDRKGQFVARGIADSGPIAVRVATTDRRDAIDDDWLRRRIGDAAALRRRVVPPRTNAFRLLHGEGDRLPGMVCDVYHRWAVLKLDGDGATAWRERLLGALREPLAQLGVDGLLVRSGRGEHLTTEPAWGGTADGPIAIEERGMQLWVDLLRGQKTGMFLDHRDSRARVRELASGSRVLNLFGYTGAFSIAAGLGGAVAVDTVDVARPALELADRSWASNGLDSQAHRSHPADVFVFLTQAAARRDRYQLVIADPPSFAPNEASVPAAIASYKKLHAACLAVLARGGLYLAASCSSHVRRDAFEDTVLAAATRARRSLQLLDGWGAAPDHPRLPAFPEGDYLKALLVRAL